MKKLICVLVVLTAAFWFSGCSDSNITGLEQNSQVKTQAVPFKGTWEGAATTPHPEMYPTPKEISCKGNCTHLGLFNADVNYMITYYDINNPLLGGYAIQGSAVMTAANGDKVYLGNLGGEWWFRDPGTFSTVEFTTVSDIVGGTGKFEGATGHFEGSGTQNFYFTNQPQETWFSWSGNINY